MIFFKYFICFSCLSYTNGHNFKEVQINTSISRTTTRIVCDFYVKRTSIVTITVAAINFQNRIRQSEVINEIIHTGKGDISAKIQDYSHISPVNLNEYNLIFIDSYEAFFLIYVKMNEKTFDFTGFYTIILTESYRDQYNIITKVLKNCWTLFITNVVFLVTVEIKTRTALYTYYPYTIYHCEVVAPVILNYFIQNSFLYENDFFPQKARNMYKCPLYVATISEIPYMFLIPQKNGTIYTDGIDGILFRVLSQRLNFTPILIIPTEEEIIKEAPTNGSSISVWMKLVHSGKANFTMSAFTYTKERAELLSASFPYFFSSLLFTVPHGRPYTAFEKLFLPFKYIIWSCISASFVVGFIVIFGIRFSTKNKRNFLVGNKNETPFLNMVNIFFGGALERLPTRNFARTLFCIWILACTVLRSAYQGALFDFIQKPKHVAPVKTIPELIQNDYTLYMTSLSFNMFKFSAAAQKRIRVHNLTLEQKFLHLMKTDFKGAFLTTEAAVSYYNMKHITTNNLVVRPTRDRVFLMPMCIYFRKHSFFKDSFDQQISLYINNGLMETWVSQFYQMKYVRVRDEQNQLHHTKLELTQLSGTYILCICMMAITIVIFFLECLSQRCVAIRKFLKIFY